MDRKSTSDINLLTFSLEKMFKFLQIILPKMKRKPDYFFNDFLLLTELHTYDTITVPYFSIELFGDLI